MTSSPTPRLAALTRRPPPLDDGFPDDATTVRPALPLHRRAGGAAGPAVPGGAAEQAAPEATGGAAAGAAVGDSVAAHLRERAAQRHRAAARVSAAYSAAYGHPVTGEGSGPGDGSEPTRRWGLSPRLAAAAAVVVLALAAGLAWWAVGGAADPVPVADTAAAVTTIAPPDLDPGTTGDVVVHVTGQVGSPGLVVLPEGSRVADAVQAAGGALESADLGAVNLARPVVDGEQVLVPLPGQTVPAGPGTGEGQSGDGLVDLNSADARALEDLPGIGPVLAERIVAWRTENGRFSSVDELGEVSGIGPAVLDRLRERVRV